MSVRLVNTKNKIDRAITTSIGVLKKNLLKTYWFKKEINFGDLLGPEILKYYGFTPLYSEKKFAEVLTVGSILDNLSEDYSGYIIGAGLKTDKFRFFPKARILAVRGRLTHERINSPKDIVLGDPGLLAINLLHHRKNKQYKLGIVPHFLDKDDERITMLHKRFIKDTLIIDPQRHPKKVIEDIDKCEFIVSSSLHGLIVADSLGIPNAWVILSNRVQGNGFKFYDYASALGMKYEPIEIFEKDTISSLIRQTNSPSKITQSVKSNLDYTFRRFQKDLGFL